jgi:hypothetical protein
MRGRRPERHALVGAYAMDAVTGADRARFERHLAGCPACARELQELRETTARLAGAVAAEPPERLLRQALVSAAGTRQLPSAGARPAGMRRAWRTGRAGRAGSVPVRGRTWPVPRPRLALALAGVFLAALAATGAIAVNAGQRLASAELRDHQIAEVLTAPDAVMLTARVKAGGTATIVMSHRDRSLVFTTAGLPPLPAGRCYQLWLMGPTGDTSAGMLPALHGGMTSPVVASGLAAGDWAGLTVEPEGGSPQPTSTPILMLSLTA